MIEDDEDDYEGYFLRPANEYNIKEKIIQANQESFAIPTPPSPRHHATGERRVTFREQLVDYEPDDYSSEDDGYCGGGGSVRGTGGGGRRKRTETTIETVADVHRDGDEGGAGVAETIIEELRLDDDHGPVDDVGDVDEEELVIEEEQLEGDYDDEGTVDRMEKHKTGVEGESVASDEDEEEEEEEEEEDEEQVVQEEEIVEEEEEEPTDGSSMDTEIHNPESSEEISSSPLKTYRSEADSRSGSGDSQGEDGAANGGARGGDGPEDDNEVNYDDDDHINGDGPDGEDGVTADADEDSAQQDGDDQGSSSDGERPIEAHRMQRSASCRRKCCRHKKSATEKLPYYNGYRSEYGLSREELEEKKRRLEARRQRVRERQQRRTAEQRQKARSNEEAFAAWLHGKLRSSINKHQNMYDVRQSAAGKQQHQLQNPKNRRRNAIHQISYG